jgi:acyl-CoA thioesterase
MGDFEKDTQVSGSGGQYRAKLSEDWKIWGPNGGYVAAIALRAAGAEARIPRPVAFAAHYLSMARFEEVELEVVPVQQGRSAESIRVSMRQAGRPVLEALVRTAAERRGLDHDAAEAPAVPDPEALRSRAELFAGLHDAPPYPFWSNLDVRPEEQERHRVIERVPGEPRARDWVRFVPRASFDDPFADAGRCLVLLDTYIWPAAFRRHPQLDYVAPNLDVVAWFHRSAAHSEWLLADAEVPIGREGLLGGRARVWSRGRELVASGGSQLLCVGPA